jgi:lysophospholipase L1-like esterase
MSLKKQIIPSTDVSTVSTLKHTARQRLFEALTNQTDVVFLGDSITAQGLWSELFPNHTVANRGIGGDTSNGISKRLDSIIKSNPKIVFLMFGINDIAQGRTVPDVFEHYQQIVKRLRSNNVEVVIQSTLLTNTDELNGSVNKLNGLLKALANKKDIVYIDLNETLTHAGKLKPNASPDGIHLYDHVYLQWRDAIISNAVLP